MNKKIVTLEADKKHKRYIIPTPATTLRKNCVENFRAIKEIVFFSDTVWLTKTTLLETKNVLRQYSKY